MVLLQLKVCLYFNSFSLLPLLMFSFCLSQLLILRAQLKDLNHLMMMIMIMLIGLLVLSRASRSNARHAFSISLNDFVLLFAFFHLLLSSHGTHLDSMSQLQPEIPRCLDIGFAIISIIY